MRKLANYFSFVMRILFKYAPNGVYKILGKFLAFLWGDVFQIRKKVIFDNIDKAFPGQTNEIKKKWMRDSLFVMCRSFFDVLKIPSLNQNWIEENIIIHGLENINKYNNEGVLFLSLHMASGDLAAAAISENIKPLSLISKRFKSEFMDEFWFSLRTKSKTEFIDAHGKSNAFDILKALKKQRGVVFVIDQFMGKPYGIESQFFGHTTGTAYGLALFALKTKAPVIPLSTYWDLDGRLNVTFGSRIDLSDLITENDGNTHQRMTNRFNQVLEQIIAQHPNQWMWVHRRWKVFE